MKNKEASYRNIKLKLIFKELIRSVNQTLTGIGCLCVISVIAFWLSHSSAITFSKAEDIAKLLNLNFDFFFIGGVALFLIALLQLYRFIYAFTIILTFKENIKLMDE